MTTTKTKKIESTDEIPQSPAGFSAIRVGLGYDLHALAANRRLVVGGVEIPSDKGELGHSDGDVLLHAIADALLGACASCDIGALFPPEDSRWKDADSAELLRLAWRPLFCEGWRIGNIDCVVNLQSPKLLPHRAKIIESVASILGIEKTCVFVKGKTGEKLGDVGCGNAVAAWATCLVFRI